MRLVTSSLSMSRNVPESTARALCDTPAQVHPILQSSLFPGTRVNRSLAASILSMSRDIPESTARALCSTRTQSSPNTPARSTSPPGSRSSVSPVASILSMSRAVPDSTAKALCNKPTPKFTRYSSTSVLPGSGVPEAYISHQTLGSWRWWPELPGTARFGCHSILDQTG